MNKTIDVINNNKSSSNNSHCNKVNSNSMKNGYKTTRLSLRN